ncbi:hypothetical protein E3P86_02789 [Wallemia ichthyophaga]|uniref:Uncharacterized protein n=1 Tax=Wallemia ichthyophaga TaxID=245174 RepID=A0A4T0J425_WALIC|nr:hypothetical protein E3P86_02789 [Wallemia ichthyophaga]
MHQEKLKDARGYNAYPGSHSFEEQVPSDIDTTFIQPVKVRVDSLNLPTLTSHPTHQLTDANALPRRLLR